MPGSDLILKVTAGICGDRQKLGSFGMHGEFRDHVDHHLSSGRQRVSLEQLTDLYESKVDIELRLQGQQMRADITPVPRIDDAQDYLSEVILESDGVNHPNIFQ
jgi:hypothetical protein